MVTLLHLQFNAFCISYYRMHSKNTRVSRDTEKGPLGPNSIPGQRWPGNQSNWQIMGSDWPSSGSYFASSWLISGSSLTRNGVWPQWTLFRVTLTRVFLECGNINDSPLTKEQYRKNLRVSERAERLSLEFFRIYKYQSSYIFQCLSFSVILLHLYIQCSFPFIYYSWYGTIYASQATDKIPISR